MAEEGYVGTSERFLKEQKGSKTINSILKTRAQWPAHVENGAAPLSGTNLLANKNAPFFSFATMIGPSPDWFVGYDSLELCNPTDCKWIESHKQELFPIDAGTDDGISYLSPNLPRSIQGFISILRSFYPTRGRLWLLGHSGSYNMTHIQMFEIIKKTK